MTLPDTLRGRMDELIDRLDHAAAAVNRKRPKRGHGDSYMACCPAHDDRNPSLSVTLEGERVLVHCFAGCEFDDVLASVGMPPEAMFEDYAGQNGVRPRIHWNGKGADATAALLDGAGEFTAAEGERMPMPPPVDTFLSLEFPPIVPLLGPIATQQLVILYAPPGVGKTMFQLAISHALASRSDFVGWRAHEAARVLIVDGEMAGQMMQSRMRALGALGDMLHIANLANWSITNGYDPINLCTEEGQSTVNLWANAVDARVIVLDNLMSLAWIDGVSMSSDEFWQPIRRFCVWQRALGRTVIVVDHSNASGEIFGTKTKLWHADLAMSLRPIDADDDMPEGFGDLSTKASRFTLKFAKVRALSAVSHTPGTAVGQWDTPSSGVGQVHDEKTITIGDVGQDWKWSCGREEQRRRAVEMARNDLSIRDIAEEIGVSKSTIGRWIKGVR